MLEQVLGAYSSRLLFDWSLPDEFDAADAALRLFENPNVWTDGSLFLDELISMLSRVGASVLYLVLFRLYKGQSCGVLFLPCRRLTLSTWRLMT